MGNSGEVKPEKSSPAAVEQNKMHVYPDWATMQAFYGPRFPVPPYMNSAPHAPPPYMWPPPQSMMPPYAAFYAHGGVYAHPGVPLANATMSMETPVKSSGNMDGGFVKKLKELDGLAMSIGNGNGDSTDPGTEHRPSDSEETDGSSDGSNGVTVGNGKKRSRQGSPSRDGKAHEKSNVEVGASKKMIGVIPAANNNTLVKTTENTNTASELKNVPLRSVTNDAWVENDRELKRERRKQSNRESARRSRLRKQAESEELAVKVQALTAENMALKSELNKFAENSEQLKLENAALIEKLNDSQLGETEAIDLVKMDDQRLRPVSTVNLLARVNNSTNEEGGDMQENRSPQAKLRQLLDASPRRDAVAAG